MTIVYSQDFESTPPGTLPSGWTDITGSASVTTSNPVSGSQALTLGSADGNIVLCEAVGAISDMEIRFDVEYQAYFVGFILRASADNSSNYTWIPSDHTLGIWNLYKRLSGSYTQIGSVSISGSTLGTIGAGSKLSLRARIQSSTIYFKIWNFGLTEPSSWTGQVSDSSVTAPGYFGFYNNSSGGGNATIDNITLDNLVVSVATDFTLAPPSQSTIVGIASGAYAVTPNGTPSAATTIALADGGAGGMFTPSSLVFTSATAQTFTYTPTTAGTKTLTATASGGFSVTHTANCVASNSVATDFALSPSSRSTGVGSATGAYTVTPNGVPPSTLSITLSDGGSGGTFSPSSLSFTTAIPQTFEYTPSSAGTILLTASGSGPFSTSHTAICSASAGSETIAVTDSALFWSPGNWDHLASGTFGVLAETMQATAPGAYIKFQVTDTANLSLNLDTSTLSEFPAGDYPILRYSIDGATFVDSQLIAGQTNLSLSMSLTTSSSHAIEVYYRMATLTEGDAWGSSGVSPTNVVRINGIVIDPGGSVSASTLRAKRMLTFSDSIGEGEHIFADGSNDSTQAFPAIVAQAMDAEYGQICYGGHGWGATSEGNVPGLVTSYQYLSVGRGRSFDSLDYILIVEGGNDARSSTPGSTIQLNCNALLMALRAACGSATKIIVAVECMGSYSSDLSTAVTTYKELSDDDQVVFADASTYFPAGVVSLNFGATTQWTYDGVHPLVYGQARFAAALAAKIQNSTTTTTTAAGLRRVGFSGGFQ